MTAFTDELARMRSAAARGDTWVQAAVTSVAPLRIKLDTDAAELPNVTPVTLVTPLRVGDRVLVQMHGLQPIVLGKIGGDRPPLSMYLRAGANERSSNNPAAPGAATTFNMCTVTLPTSMCVNGNRFRITCHGHVQGDTLNAYCDIQTKIGVSAAVGGTQIGGTYAHQYIAAGRQIPFSFTHEYVYGTNGELDGQANQNIVLTGLASAGNSYCVASVTRKTSLFVDLVVA